MDDEELGKEAPDTIPVGPDEHTTAPEPDKPGKWKMPEPVFQQSSGYLPQGYVQKIQEQTQAASSNGETAVPAAINTPAPQADIEPQPDLSDILASNENAPAQAAVVEPKNSGSGIVTVVSVFLAILVFAAIFLAVVYFLFLAPAADVNNF